jgi:hypothetical protein
VNPTDLRKSGVDELLDLRSRWYADGRCAVNPPPPPAAPPRRAALAREAARILPRALVFGLFLFVVLVGLAALFAVPAWAWAASGLPPERPEPARHEAGAR